VYKTANVLNKVALSVQANMKQDLREIYLAPSRALAEVAIDVFAEKYQAKHHKAVECLTKDREALLAFFNFPAEHWDHLRTTNPSIRNGPAQDSADKRFVVGNDRQADGVHAGYRRIKNLAAAESHKSLAEDCRRCQIQRRHRGPRSAGKPRRLIAPRHLQSLIAQVEIVPFDNKVNPQESLIQARQKQFAQSRQGTSLLQLCRGRSEYDR
jgi:hypothetical protein